MDEFEIEKLGEPTIDNNLGFHLQFMDKQRVLMEVRIKAGEEKVKKNQTIKSFEKSGPRSKIYFNPKSTKVAIATCGGLCPGMNAIIRGLVRQLWNRYQVKNIVGVRYGYQGLGKLRESFLNLDLNNTEDIYRNGGTVLGSSRGNPPVEEMIDTLEQNNINVLFAVGGDGTMRGAHQIYQEIKKRNLKISIIGIPKTIDNDIPFVNRSFGYETAVEKASEVVFAGHEEARGHHNGIGLVKLMGRNAGFIAAGTVMATGVVNLCLIPEIKFTLDGTDGLFEDVKKRLYEKQHMMIVVAEGAGIHLMQKKKNKRDPSGNLVLPDIGLFLKSRLSERLKKESIPYTLKYIDPSYFIRSSRPNNFDLIFCSRLAQNAVHAAMSGKTDMLVGYWHGEMTHIPLAALTGKTKSINPHGTYWLNVTENTNQLIGKF